MMLRKWFTAAAVTLSLAAVAALLLLLYTTALTDGEAGTLVVRGYNLVEFSPWGGVVVLAPLALVGLLLGRLSPAIQTLGALSLLLVDGAALCAAVAAARRWIDGVATGWVEPQMGHLLYAMLLLGAAVCLWVAVNGRPEPPTDTPQ